MTVSNPNRKCPCGYTRFRESGGQAAVAVNRWVRFVDDAVGGFGVTEFGTFFGAGNGGSYGLFPGTQRVVSRTTACESCGRVRASKNTGGAVAFGIYLVENVAYVVCSDVARPIAGYQLSAYEAFGTGFVVPLSFAPGTPEALITTTPATVSATMPTSDVAGVLLSAVIPEVVISANYVFTFIDTNSGYDTTLATIYLEEPP
jgi:hypothetical protein